MVDALSCTSLLKFHLTVIKVEELLSIIIKGNVGDGFRVAVVSL